jgi:iron complex outermembrane receptor protein
MALSYVPNAVAQDADVQEFDDATIEEVVVTGSRIARADIDSASPVTVMSRDDIEATGLTDIGSLLQSMPSMSGSPVGTTTNNGNTNTGSVRIDLRGMGPARTLTLLNGHRMVDSDFQAIPSMMIDRIEILKDGASAVYGADAVSGVVNIITRRDFQGVELTAQVADWQDTKAGMMYSFGAIAGSEFERGNVVIGLEYVDQEEAYQSDVPWDYFQHSPYIYPEGCENQPMAPYTGSPDGGCFLIGSSRIPQSRLGFVSQGTFLIGQANTTPYGVGLMEPHDGRQYNYAPVNYMQTPFERTNIFGEAHFDITDSVRFNAEFRANFRESGQQLAPQPYNSPTDPGYNGVWEGLPYSGIHQDNYYLRNAVDAYNAATGSSLVYEPVRDARRRMIEIPRTYDQDVTQYQYVVGFEGTFADMDWDVFLNQGHRSIVSINRGQFDGIRLGNAMGPSADMDGDGMPECYTDVSDPASLIAGCVPFNFFGGGEVDPVTSQPTVTTVTQDMLDYVSATLTNHRQWDATSFGANITGNVFNLPGGPLGWAAGYGYWKQEYRYSPDSGVAAGTVTGNTGPGTEGSLTNNSVYLEVLAPVWDNGTQELILKGGLRYDDWDQFDGDSTWQFGAEFQAIESLKLRGTYGTVFRAPTISDLFAGQVDSFPTYSDPCVARGGEPIAPGCAQEGVQLDTQVLAKVGGNPNLFPETGDTYTVGMVWTPEFGDHGFSATVDYWSIDLEDAISSLGVQFTLDSCYQDLDPNACALITRRPADYSVGQIIDGSINVADQGAKGVDTELRWDYASNVGAWQASILWVHMLERTKTAFAGAEERDLAGRYSDSTAEDGGAYAQDKANFKLQWMLGDLSIGYLGEYISGMDADTFCNCDSDGDPSNNGPDGTYIQDVSSIWYHDLVAAYTWRSFTVSGGLTNLSDEEPPMIETGFNATTDPATYRMFGRGYYLRLSWKY